MRFSTVTAALLLAVVSSVVAVPTPRLSAGLPQLSNEGDGTAVEVFNPSNDRIGTVVNVQRRVLADVEDLAKRVDLQTIVNKLHRIKGSRELSERQELDELAKRVDLQTFFNKFRVKGSPELPERREPAEFEDLTKRVDFSTFFNKFTNKGSRELSERRELENLVRRVDFQTFFNKFTNKGSRELSENRELEDLVKRVDLVNLINKLKIKE